MSNYLPKHLTSKDRRTQRKNLNKSRKLYKKGIYFNRPTIKSFQSKPSPHVSRACKLYNVSSLTPNALLAKKTKCKLSTLQKIVKKGEGASYSSGSRPNQSAKAWGLARLGSSLTGNKASKYDYHLLKDGCEKTSLALKLATRRKNRVF